MDFIMQMRPWFDDAEKKALQDYMDTDGFLTEFKLTEEFELRLAEYTGAKHCIVVNNGTISLTLAAMALGIGAGDEVIVPNYTMVATPNSMVLAGASPVFVDVEPESLSIDIQLVEKAITESTKAVVFVSPNGRYPPYGMQELESLCRAHGIHLIEDAAQGLGSFFPDGRHIGTAGDIGSFSFSAPKIISTGQGGALVTNDDEAALRLRKLKDFGRTSGGNDIHDSIGFNFKFTELQAAIGLSQLKKLDYRVKLKKEIWDFYNENLKGISGVNLFFNDCKFTSPWFYDCIVEGRASLQQFLKEKKIGTRVMYPPINKQDAYQSAGDHPVSNFVGLNGLWLPSQAQLSKFQLEHICESIREFYGAR